MRIRTKKKFKRNGGEGRISFGNPLKFCRDYFSLSESFVIKSTWLALRRLSTFLRTSGLKFDNDTLSVMNLLRLSYFSLVEKVRYDSLPWKKERGKRREIFFFFFEIIGVKCREVKNHRLSREEICIVWQNQGLRCLKRFNVAFLSAS